MQFRTSSARLGVPTAVFLFALLIPSAANAASRFRILHSFSAGMDGGGLYAGLAFDQKGNLYGTTSGGGRYGQGTVFKLKPQPTGQWFEKVLHNFQIDADGYDPESTPVFDAAGNLYGTAQLGGENHGGTAFQMTPAPSGWTFNVIYNFCAQPSCADGGASHGGFALDAAGNLYGVLTTVLELSPSPEGWTASVLYTFCAKAGCADGNGSFAPLILDSKGNLFGVTYGGGTYNLGTVFKVRRLPDGTWNERVLHSFGWSDGQFPYGQLAFDSSGNLYGTTTQGGRYGCGLVGCGTVFSLIRQPNGHWKESILHNFKPGKGGYAPFAGVVIDSAGNLYGAAAYGGTDCNCGVIYKLSPNPDGTWAYSVLHRFRGSDGAEPASNLIFDDQGNLYGTAVTGGPGGAGVVFKLTP